MTILNQPLVLVLDSSQARELIVALTEAIRDGRAIVVSGESAGEAKPSHPGIVRAMPTPLAQTLRRVG